jgi:hypothetical protein
MNALTPLGMIHTAISLVAVVAGFMALARYRQIAWAQPTGRLYVIATLLTCLTGFGIFQHGGFGKPHVLGSVTLGVLGFAFWAGARAWAGPVARLVAPVAYSTTLFLHMIPGVTETFTRLPTTAPVFASPEDPALQKVIGVVFLVFLVGVGLQVRHLRRSGAVMAGATPAA